MNPHTTTIRDEYVRELSDWLASRSESCLVRAGALGRQAIAEGLGLLDIVVIHHGALNEALRPAAPGPDREAALELAATFLCETLSPFEMALRGFKETSVAITRTVQFAAAVSHELRTPLTSLMGSAGMLAEILDPAPESNEGKLLANIRMSIGILKARTDDLLDLVGLQSGALSIRPQRVELPPLLAGVIDRITSRSSSVPVRLSVSGDVPPIVADPDRLQQVISNLVDNALKYGGDGGRVDVRAAVTGGMVSIEVQDYGVGVSRWDRLRIWQPNYRGPDREADIPGLGIGLALCRELVQQHRGRISLESEEGKGSLFRVELPLPGPSGKAGEAP